MLAVVGGGSVLSSAGRFALSRAEWTIIAPLRLATSSTLRLSTQALRPEAFFALAKILFSALRVAQIKSSSNAAFLPPGIPNASRLITSTSSWSSW